MWPGRPGKQDVSDMYVLVVITWGHAYAWVLKCQSLFSYKDRIAVIFKPIAFVSYSKHTLFSCHLKQFIRIADILLPICSAEGLVCCLTMYLYNFDLKLKRDFVLPSRFKVLYIHIQYVEYSSVWPKSTNFACMVMIIAELSCSCVQEQ